MDADRLKVWRRKLRPLLLDVELDPVESQLGRKWRAVATLSGVFGVVASIFLAIFAGFGRVDVGGWVVGILVGIPMAWAWVDVALLRRRVSAYLLERNSLSGG